MQLTILNAGRKYLKTDNLAGKVATYFLSVKCIAETTRGRRRHCDNVSKIAESYFSILNH